MLRRFLALLTFLTAIPLSPIPAATAAAAPAPAVRAGLWRRPVAGPVVRPFRPPLTRYGAGHLGVDLAAPPGTLVRTAGAGTVVFAGVVAGTRHVVVRHPGGLRTSYSFLATTRVRVGESVARGAVLGTSGGTGEHHDGGVFHLGLRVGETYVDPMALFGPPDLAAIVHLAPVATDPGFAPGNGRDARALERGVAVAPAATAPVVAEPPRAAANPLRSVLAGRRTAAGRPLYPR